MVAEIWKKKTEKYFEKERMKVEEIVSYKRFSTTRRCSLNFLNINIFNRSRQKSCFLLYLKNNKREDSEKVISPIEYIYFYIRTFIYGKCKNFRRKKHRDASLNDDSLKLYPE